MSNLVERAADFVWRTARVLEQHRFAHHYRGADAEPVARALGAYRTPEHGYGFALEPDLRGPIPQPLTAAFALRMLDDVGLLTSDRVTDLVGHLGSIQRPDGGLPALHADSANWPSAQVVPVEADSPGALLSTGSIIGLLLRHDVEAPWLPAAVDFCWAAIEALGATHPYEVESALTFLDAVDDRHRAGREAERLGELVMKQRLVPLDPFDCADHPVSPGYSPGEHHFAVEYVTRPSSLAAAWFTPPQLSRALDHLAGEQREDGGWPMRWRNWGPPIEVEWRGVITVDALRVLQGHGRL